MKTRLWIVMLLVAFAACGVLAQNSDNPTEKPVDMAKPTVTDSAAATADSASAAVKTEAAPRIIVYYFHSTRRCSNCFKIETYAHEAVEGFAPELESGELVWRMVNTDEEENRHFIDDYQLFTKSVVLVEMDGDKQVRWKNLDKIWTLLSNQEEFVQYVQDELTTFMSADE